MAALTKHLKMLLSMLWKIHMKISLIVEQTVIVYQLYFFRKHSNLNVAVPAWKAMNLWKGHKTAAMGTTNDNFQNEQIRSCTGLVPVLCPADLAPFEFVVT